MHTSLAMTASEWIAVVLLAVLFVAVVHTAMCARCSPPPLPPRRLCVAVVQTVNNVDRLARLHVWFSAQFRALTRTRPCHVISNNRSQQVQNEDGDGEEFRYMSMR
jgi:hypothetical protein